MNAFLVFGLALALAGAADAQTGERGSLPPGQSQDGAAPADGAIKGGAILPGESAGSPDSAERAKVEKRCDQLSGTLREECLKQSTDTRAGEPQRRLPVPEDSAAGSSSSPR
jgi:hypothetical protein